MIEIADTLVSSELLEREFVCNLSACRGACCVEGESGAPLTEAECETLEKELHNIKPFLRLEGLAALTEQGTHVRDADGDLVTPLRDGAECAYTVFEGGVASCGIEKAWKAGATEFRKPISCHLYPARLTEYRNFTAVNYHHWPICSPACALGAELKVPVYRFLKEALVRRFGQPWYDALKQAAEENS